MTKIPTLLLASNSPRRRQLLALGGWAFDVDVSNTDESLLPAEQPVDYVRRLAEAKARVVVERARPGQVIIGADTSVVIDNDILGKPADAAEARSMLRRLRGRSHQVYTGIAVLRASDRNLLTDVVVTDVPMRAYSDAEIDTYILTGDPLDKAGAYGIQNPDFQPVAHMEGCYASVMGLPVCSLAALLGQMDVLPANDVAGNCQATLQYQCPISHLFLTRVRRANSQ
ncbi:MAG: septum formation protein Maf [Chloroflexi bacterium]|nr:MAG: septum formation protein Maf [Chloroflexota bacterium]